MLLPSVSEPEMEPLLALNPLPLSVSLSLSTNPDAQVRTAFRDELAELLAAQATFFAKYWSEWQDLNLRPPRPERGGEGSSGVSCHKGDNTHCMGSPDAMRTGGKHLWLTGRASH